MVPSRVVAPPPRTSQAAAASGVPQAAPASNGRATGHRSMISYGEGLLELNEANDIIWHYQDPDVPAPYSIYTIST